MVVNVINEENIKRNKNIFLKKPKSLLPHLQKRGENKSFLIKQRKNMGFLRNQQKNPSEKREQLHLIPKVMEIVASNNGEIPMQKNGEKQVSPQNQQKILLPEKREKIQTGIRRKKKLWLNWGRDIFFQSVWLNKLQNRLMRHGKKGIAEKILVKMLTILNQQGKGNAFLIFHQALNQIRPVLTVIPRRVGRRIYQVPVPLERKKQYKLALKWITGLARNKKKTGGGRDWWNGRDFSHRIE